jgi:hypothetical protein
MRGGLNMNAILSLDVTDERTQMVIKFPDCILRFAVTPTIKNINKVLSYKDGIIGILVNSDNTEDYLDLNHVGAWVAYKPNIDNIVLEEK